MAELILILAMTCVSEISLQPDPTECLVMWEINQRTADRKGISLMKQTKLFNAMFKRKTLSRPWLRNLNLEGTMPEGWFGTEKSWTRNMVWWLGYVKAAHKFLQGHRSLCPKADDYGGKMDHPPRSCYRRIQCLEGKTFQWYWDTSKCR